VIENKRVASDEERMRGEGALDIIQIECRKTFR